MSEQVPPPRVICLLPARNAAADLPRFLESAAHYCDAIIALDDGSTDNTLEILEASPLVARLIRNPVRVDYRDWDDAANRNRLLTEAADFAPDWIISVDADECIDPSDARALREFLATDALPGCAYGFHHVPMRGDAEHYLPQFQWVYRLFSYAPDQRFPRRRLHFVPVPTAIPRRRWINTTLRIQHFGGMTVERRQARFRKYEEADPVRRYQSNYDHLLHDPSPDELRRWEARPPGLPVLAAAASLVPGEATDTGHASISDQSRADSVAAAPALSAIVIARDNEDRIARTVASVVGQDVPEPFETIVVVSGTDRTAAIVREQYPDVTLVELPRPALPGEARNAGLRVARGEFVSFPGSHVELPPGSLAARLRAHRRGYAMVTGVTRNGTLTAAGWASYFLDHHEGLPGHRPSLISGPPAHCSYARIPLLETGGFPEGVRTGEDTVVNRELVRRGYVAFRDPQIEFTHASPCRTPWRLLRHHFQRGCGWGRLLLEDHRHRGRLLNRETLSSWLMQHLPRRLQRISQNVRRAEPGLVPQFSRVRPLVVAGALAAWLGFWFEILRPSAGKGVILIGRPNRTLLVVATRRVHPPSAAIVRADLVLPKVRWVPIAPDLPVLQSDGSRAPASTMFDELARSDSADSERTSVLMNTVGRSLDIGIEGYIIGPERLVVRYAGPGAAAGDLDTALPKRVRPVATLVECLRLGMLGADINTSLGRWERMVLLMQLHRAAAHGARQDTAGGKDDIRSDGNARSFRERLGIPSPADQGTTHRAWWP
jgi:glycosyltransferase involved in cell wall biosynthesis